jgi:DNA-binding response OmpR family regulator
MTTVLLVEDNLTLIESIAFELEMRDYTVLQATDGKEALALLQKGDVLPDIVVSDIAMPDMDGYELLEAVRANHDWELIPFIFLTAFDSPNAQRIGKDLGVDDYLTKPFEPDELVSAMENKIKRTRQIEAHAARDLDKTRHELLTMISHELRTPLTSIFGSSELLKNSLVDVPDTMTQDLLTLLQSGVRRMNRLVNRILFMVQIESGYIKAQLDALNESLI